MQESGHAALCGAQAQSLTVQTVLFLLIISAMVLLVTALK